MILIIKKIIIEKRKIKINKVQRSNLNSFIFKIRILINISFCLKLSVDLIFPTKKKNNFKIQLKKMLFKDFSNVINASKLSNNHLNYNYSEYRQMIIILNIV